MDKKKIIEIVNDVKNRPNSDLIEARDMLKLDFDKAKQLVIELTRHIESIEEFYTTIINEIKNREG